jgi:hypothetical protein
VSTDIALRSDVPTNLTDQMELAKALAVSGLLPQHLQSKPQNILAIMYAARSIDVPLWQAIQSMQVINGKVGLSADLARALILRAGHTFRVVESTNEVATVEVVRKGDDYVHRASFTLDDAHAAKLTGNPSWSKYPKAMLIARATTLIARNACADVLAGMSYTAEELGATVDEEGRIVDSKPVPPNVEGQPRALEELPRNKNGSVSRSRVSEEEKEAHGLMTAEEMKEHTALQPKSEGKAERHDGTPADDPWLDSAGTLEVPKAESEKFCDDWLEQLDACISPAMVHSQEAAARAAHRDGRIATPQLNKLLAAGKAKVTEVTAA